MKNLSNFMMECWLRNDKKQEYKITLTRSKIKPEIWDIAITYDLQPEKRKTI